MYLVLRAFCNSGRQPFSNSSDKASAVEEAHAAHYIGGLYVETKAQMTMMPSQQQSQEGRLTNLTEDGKCIYVGLEEIFRAQYPKSVTKIEQSNFIENAKTIS